jgi:hypothetical protein
MDERIIDYLNDHKEDLPFSHIFGDEDLRIIIPIYSDPTAKDIINTLKRIKDYGGIDLDTGEIVRKIKLDPKYGGDEKEQRMKLGSAISKLKLTDDDKKRYLDWLARYKENLKDTLGGSKYTIILSRAPIDVVRMSDHSGWTSCHTQGHEYFQCAVQEAINGGAVAYIVETEDLNEFLSDQYNSLQDEEIFLDDARHSSDMSLEPLSRLRVRRLTWDDGREMAIPDTRVYGRSSIPQFYESLKGFLKDQQPMDLEEFKASDWRKRGGTYYDNNILELVKNYYDIGDDTEHGIPRYITHHDPDRMAEAGRNQELKELFNNLEEECEQHKNYYNERMKYCKVEYDISWDDTVYCMPGAYAEIVFDYTGIDFSNVDLTLDDEGDFERAKNGDYDDDITWSGLMYWLDQQFRGGLDVRHLSFIDNKLEISFSSENVFFDSYEYEEYCKDVDRFDDNILEAFAEPNDWVNIFEEIGIIESDNTFLKQLVENGSEDLTYHNTRGERHVEWELIVDGITNETYETYSDSTSFNGIPNIRDRSFIGDEFAKILDNYIKDNYKIKPSTSHQQTFNKFFESYYQPRMMGNNTLTQFNIDSLEIEVDPSTHLQELNNVLVILNVKLNVEEFDEENVGLILFLDRNLDDLRNMARFAYLSQNRYIITGSPKYKQLFHNLKRVYGKYLA